MAKTPGLMATQMGLQLVGGLADYATMKIQADLQKAVQAYRNTMSALSAARSKNAITVNEIGVRDAGVQNEEMIQKMAMRDQAQARLAAAAAGVKGTSHDLVMQDFKASAGRASYANTRKVNAAMRELGNQRTSVEIGQIFNKDINVIPKPSLGAALLGIGTNLLNTYDKYQPAGEKLLGGE